MVGNLIFFAVVLGLIAAAHAGRLLFKLHALRREGAAAWAERREAGASDIEGLDERAFQRAYFRAFGPRGALHAYAGAALAALASAPALIVLGAAWRVGWRLSGEPELFKQGSLIWQFYLFFGLIAVWAITAGFVMQHYHRNRPRELRYELARERDRARRGVAAAPEAPK